MKYSTILFDVDDTLLDFLKCERVAVSLTMQQNGIEASDENVALYSSINDSFWKRFERGEIEKCEIYEGRFKEFINQIGSKSDVQKVSNEYIKALADQCFWLDGAKELLDALKGKYKIYLTTNGNAETQEKRIKNSGLISYCQDVFVSEAIGHQKPELEYFNYVFEHIDEKDKEKIVIIGDSQSSDILGGKNAGLDTIWYNPKGLKATHTATYTVSSLAELKNLLCR